MQKIRVPLEIKALNEREFSGYGSVFGNEDHGGDVVMRGAFTKSLREKESRGQLPQMFWAHDPSRVPGKWLEMREDKHGLAVKGVLADTPLGNEILTLVKMEAVRGLSIGFVTKEQEFEEDGTRLIKEVDLWEVSIVSLPMNPLAEVVHVHSRLSAAGEYVPTIKELERILRNEGCSIKVAKQMVYNIKALRNQDTDSEMETDPPRNADDEVASAAQKLADKILADVIRRKLAA